MPFLSMKYVDKNCGDWGAFAGAPFETQKFKKKTGTIGPMVCYFHITYKSQVPWSRTDNQDSGIVPLKPMRDKR